MKFLCDRCKTRYSIGDDRVRGKILKIRCKNCANVITVREGMSDAAADGEAAEPHEARRTRPTTAAPVAQVTARGGGNALNAAFKSQLAKPPPALEEEWYVSIDGDQSGPFSLADAQRWIAGKPLEADLHCWSEGFDDWLPVDKVSHFRNLRKPRISPSAPPPTPRGVTRSTGQPAAIGAQAARAQPEEEPKPLFAATMASLEKSAPAGRATLPAAAPIKAQPAAATRTNGAASARGASIPASIPASVPRPAGPVTPMAKPGSGPARGATAQGIKPVAVSAGAKALAEAFSVTAEAEPQDSLTAVEAPAFVDEIATSAEPVASRLALDRRDPAEVAPSFAPALASVSPFAAPQPAPMASAQPAPMASAQPVPLAALSSGVPGHDLDGRDVGDDEDNLDIGEVSRVVKLADLQKMDSSRRTVSRPPGALRAPTAAVSAIRGTGAVPKLDPAGLGMAPGLAPAGDEPAPGESLIAAPVVARAHRRGLIMLIGVAAVLLLGVVGAVVFMVSGGGDDLPLGLGGSHGIDTSRPDDPSHPRNPVDPGPGSGSAVKPPVKHWTGPNPNTHPGTGSAGSAEDNPGGNALKADEVEDMVRKQQGGIERCYMRAQKGVDGITLGDVKKIAVTMTIDKEGGVTDVQLSEHGGDSLGKCLATRVRTMKFRVSTNGGTFKIVLAAPSG